MAGKLLFVGFSICRMSHRTIVVGTDIKKHKALPFLLRHDQHQGHVSRSRRFYFRFSRFLTDWQSKFSLRVLVSFTPVTFRYLSHRAPHRIISQSEMIFCLGKKAEEEEGGQICWLRAKQSRWEEEEEFFLGCCWGELQRFAARILMSGWRCKGVPPSASFTFFPSSSSLTVRRH